MKYLFLIFFTYCTIVSAFAQSFTGATGAIADQQTVEFPITVSGLPTSANTTTFGLEKACFDLTHTWVNELVIKLRSPSGMEITLFDGASAQGGGNFTNTCINGVATMKIDYAPEPRTGTFKGFQKIGLLNNGQNPNGIWKLIVVDDFWGSSGVLNSCSLTFSNTPASYFIFAESDLPIVVINTNGVEIADEPKIMADMGIIYNGLNQRNHLTDPANNYTGKIGIETRGDFSSSLPQKSYGFELWDANSQAIEQELIGMPAESDWVLVANYNDKSFVRNVLAHKLFSGMGHYGVRTRLVDVVLNNDYQGIYMLAEKIKRDSNRVDVPKLTTDEISGIDLTGGYIVKIEFSTESETDHWNLPYCQLPMVYYYPQEENLAPVQATYIQGVFNAYETALYGTNFADPIDGFRKYIHTESFIDYLIMAEFSMNGDGYLKSRYFYKDKDHADGTYRKIKAGPVWDFDWSMKYYSDETYIGLNYLNGSEFPGTYAGWYTRMLEDPLFANEFRCRYEDLRRSVLKETYIDHIIDSVAAFVDESQNWHFDLWGNLGIITGSPEIYASQTYTEEIQRLKTLLHNRLTWLDANIPGTLNGCSMTGLDDLSNSQSILAYPNPFTNGITVEWPHGNLSGCTLRMRDETGRLFREIAIETSMVVDNSLHLTDLNDLSQGVYFIELVRGDDRKVIKVVK